MPRYFVSFDEGMTPTPCYDLYYPVGFTHPGGANLNYKPDVAFVQFLLKGIFETNHKNKPLNKIGVDGVFGPSTHYWIMYFQHSMRFKYNKLFPEDGYVANYNDALLTQYPAFQYSMIGLLNSYYRRANPSVDFFQLEKSPFLPPVLKGTFKNL